MLTILFLSSLTLSLSSAFPKFLQFFYLFIYLFIIIIIRLDYMIAVLTKSKFKYFFTKLINSFILDCLTFNLLIHLKYKEKNVKQLIKHTLDKHKKQIKKMNK